MEKRAWSDWLWVYVFFTGNLHWCSHLLHWCYGEASVEWLTVGIYVFHWKFALEQPPTALSHEEATMEGLMFVCSPVGEVLWRAVEEKCQRNIWVWNRRQTGQLHHHLQIPGRQGRLPTGGWFFLYGLFWRHQPYYDVINHIMTVINVGNNGLL